MKNRRILSMIVAVFMIVSIMSIGVSARNPFARGSYLDEHEYTVYSNGSKVGEGTLDFGTYSEKGAYASCTRTSSSYKKAYCKLISKNGSSVLKSDFGYHSTSASCYIAVAYAGTTVDLTLIVYNPTANDTIPSNSPTETATVAWYQY